MALTTNTDDLDIIAALDDEPNDTGGLTAAQLKAKFDEAANTLQTWINGTHIPELDADHLPYIYGVATTIKETVDAIVLGTIPDDSLTFAKIDSDDVATEAEAQAGTANDVFATPLSISRYASNLLASQAEAEAGTDNTKTMTPLRTAQAIAGLGVQIASGSYTGTGTYGSENANSISLGFQAKLVLLTVAAPAGYMGVEGRVRSDNFQLFVLGQTSVTTSDQPGYMSYPTFGASAFSWYHNTSAARQMNTSETTYYYVAIG